MNIKSLQSLVSEAMHEIKTISVDEALKMVEENDCNLIDISFLFFFKRTTFLDI